MLADVFGDGFAANFFFAFEENAHIDRQLAIAGAEERFKCLHLHPQLALVVDGAARVDVLVALGGLKGRRGPFFNRIGRLHVVMRVTQHCRFAGCMQPVGVDHGMTGAGDDFDVLETDALEFTGHEVGGLLDVVFVFVHGADAGNAQQFF